MDGAVLEDRTLRRFIAMLVALAVLAERAAGRSFPVRWFVLTVLRRAEAVVQAFVVEATHATWPGFEEPLETGNHPVDATLLGLRFRVLAAVLSALLGPTRRSDEDGASIVRAPRCFASGPDRLLAMPGGATLRPPYDTS
ncbi:MAG: hypothetical protein K5872_18930 [Rhizobiaceae bacterium]|nr:hypothetical protein [Rhizobiaceae bacterium]MCV0408302.1 hypothetical protein [Rhizobiaceae bacterium]